MNQIQLLVRPRWIPGESWAGYLLRVANANEIPGIHLLGEMLGVSVSQLLVAQPRIVLRALGRWADTAPTVRYPALRASRARLAPDKARQLLMVRGRRLETAFCPYCLAGDHVAHQRALWERPLEVGCRTHGTQLLRRCSVCNCVMQADRPSLLECPCGASLLDQEAGVLNAAWTLMPPAFSLGRSTADGETFQPTSSKEMVAAAVIERLALHELGQEPAARKQRVSAKPSLAAVEVASPWFEDWPNGFENRYRKALEQGRTVDGERCTSYIQAKTLFAPMFPQVQRAAVRVARSMRFRPRHDLVRGLDDYLSCAVQSVDSAKKLLGISRAQAEWLHAIGAFPGSKRISRHALAIPTEAVLDLMAQFSETEDWRVAAGRRGLNALAMKQVLRIGLLPAISLGDYGACRVEPGPWDCFCDFLLSQATPLANGASQTVRLEAVIAASHQVSPDASRTARIVAAIARGSLHVYAPHESPKKLNELLVSMSQLKRVAPRHG